MIMQLWEYLLIVGIPFALIVFGFLVWRVPGFNIFLWEVLLGQRRYIAELKVPAGGKALYHVGWRFVKYPEREEDRTFQWKKGEYEHPTLESQVKERRMGHDVVWYQINNQTPLVSDVALPDDKIVESRKHLAFERSSVREYKEAQKRGLDLLTIALCIGLVVAGIGAAYFYSQYNASVVDMKYKGQELNNTLLKLSYYEYYLANHGGIPNVPGGWNGTTDGGGMIIG